MSVSSSLGLLARLLAAQGLLPPLPLPSHGRGALRFPFESLLPHLRPPGPASAPDGGLRSTTCVTIPSVAYRLATGRRSGGECSALSNAHSTDLPPGAYLTPSSPRSARSSAESQSVLRTVTAAASTRVSVHLVRNLRPARCATFTRRVAESLVPPFPVGKRMGFSSPSGNETSHAFTTGTGHVPARRGSRLSPPRSPPSFSASRPASGLVRYTVTLHPSTCPTNRACRYPNRTKSRRSYAGSSQRGGRGPAAGAIRPARWSISCRMKSSALA